MKKLLLILCAFSLMSCVDKDFDLGDVDDDGIVFGDEFVAPIGVLNIRFTDMFGVVGTTTEEINITSPRSLEGKISGGFDKGIVDQLTNSGEQYISAVVNTNLPDGVVMNVEVSFDSLDQPIVSGDFDRKHTTYKMKVDKEMLSKIAEATKIIVRFKYVSGAESVTIDLSDGAKIDLTLHRKGGIKLN